MHLLVGIIGLVGLIFFAVISGGGIDPFIDIPSLLIVAGGAFFSALAMSKGKFNHETVNFFGNSALTLGWIGLLIGLVSAAQADVLCKPDPVLNVMVKNNGDIRSGPQSLDN